jgi:hypothetical protein
MWRGPLGSGAARSCATNEVQEREEAPRRILDGGELDQKQIKNDDTGTTALEAKGMAPKSGRGRRGFRFAASGEAPSPCFHDELAATVRAVKTLRH